MKRTNGRLSLLSLIMCMLTTCCVAQVSSNDYARAARLRNKYKGLALDVADTPLWLKGTHKFCYRKTVEGGTAFVTVDADSATRQPTFDHAKMADTLSKATAEKFAAATLPFRHFRFNDTGTAIEFPLKGFLWSCEISANSCVKHGKVHEDYWGFEEENRGDTTRRVAASPDGKLLAFIQNYNIYVRPTESSGKARPLSFDGTQGNAYDFDTIRWSPDSRHLVAYRVMDGYHRKIQFIESSPQDQLQPKYSSIDYAKPGDVLDHPQPVLFDATSGSQVEIDSSLFPNPYELSPVSWWNDGRAFTFEYNQRGHQVYRVIEVDVTSGVPRTLISEESKTFIDYPRLINNQFDTGKTYRHDVHDGKEIIWMSERDGWAHLYLFDGRTGKLKNQITKGNWVVRAVDHVDEERRQILFQASGMVPGQDPYFYQAYRINFDGTGLTALTHDDANHTISYSEDGKYFVDIKSRIDLVPTVILRRAEDGSSVMTLETANVDKLLAAGWRPPDVFTATGRDGKTDIWGVIHKPANFDPERRFPVVEKIYAGPQGSFVPKSFLGAAEPLTELGFVVVQIDGMGTNNRSKAFHDVAWKNLKDGGFLDRILWHKAVAAKYPWYDISRVGVFGNSAGGQNALAALLFHPEFYKAAVANSGSHDNRMDKIWWNELWMSWPIGPQYAECSNVDNAYRLKGKLLLVLGEMDSNVDPASTLQVANALIKHNKNFDLLFVPGGEHGAGGEYGQRVLQDFFVKSLLHEWPPDWNQEETVDKNASAE